MKLAFWFFFVFFMFKYLCSDNSSQAQFQEQVKMAKAKGVKSVPVGIYLADSVNSAGSRSRELRMNENI